MQSRRLRARVYALRFTRLQLTRDSYDQNRGGSSDSGSVGSDRDACNAAILICTASIMAIARVIVIVKTIFRLK